MNVDSRERINTKVKDVIIFLFNHQFGVFSRRMVCRVITKAGEVAPKTKCLVFELKAVFDVVWSRQTPSFSCFLNYWSAADCLMSPTEPAFYETDYQ